MKIESPKKFFLYEDKCKILKTTAVDTHKKLTRPKPTASPTVSFDSFQSPPPPKKKTTNSPDTPPLKKRIGNQDDKTLPAILIPYCVESKLMWPLSSPQFQKNTNNTALPSHSRWKRCSSPCERFRNPKAGCYQEWRNCSSSMLSLGHFAVENLCPPPPPSKNIFLGSKREPDTTTTGCQGRGIVLLPHSNL